jgi:hypothetical protein
MPSSIETSANLMGEKENGTSMLLISCQLYTNVIVGISAEDKQQTYEYLAQPGTYLCCMKCLPEVIR